MDEVCRWVLRFLTAKLHQALHASKERDVRTTNEGNSVNVSNPIAGIFISTGKIMVMIR